MSRSPSAAAGPYFAPRGRALPSASRAQVAANPGVVSGAGGRGDLRRDEVMQWKSPRVNVRQEVGRHG